MSGPTGLLGEYLLKDLLLAGWNVAVLCRSAPGSQPSDRIEDLLHRWEDRLRIALPRPVVIESDLTQPMLGISDSDLAWIKRHCTSFLHNAASLTFEANREDGEPWLSNLTGTQHAIEVCKAAEIGCIFHVSTAYVCGRRTGSIFEEELDLGQSFATEYEASKCASELEWKQASFSNLTILRPAIIVGDSETGYTSTYHGFYAPLKSMATLLSQAARSTVTASNHVNGSSGDSQNGSSEQNVASSAVPLEPMLAALGLTGEEEKNFVPVEWVSRVIVAVASTQTAWNKTYHLTPSQRVSARTAAVAMQRSLVKYFEKKQSPPTKQTNAVNATFATGPASQESATKASASNTDWSMLGRAFSHQVSAYQEYWRDDPVFDASNRIAFAHAHDRADLDCPILDETVLERLCDFAIQSGFGWPKRRIKPHTDSLNRWLEEHGLEAGIVDSRMVQLRAIGPGGGQAVIGFDQAGKLTYEIGVATEIPSVTFGLTHLRSLASFSQLEAAGLAWVQLPVNADDSNHSVSSDTESVITLLDRIAAQSFSSNSLTIVARS